jgi:hypothetical protein
MSYNTALSSNPSLLPSSMKLLVPSTGITAPTSNNSIPHAEDLISMNLPEVSTSPVRLLDRVPPNSRVPSIVHSDINSTIQANVAIQQYRIGIISTQRKSRINTGTYSFHRKPTKGMRFYSQIFILTSRFRCFSRKAPSDVIYNIYDQTNI